MAKCKWCNRRLWSAGRRELCNQCEGTLRSEVSYREKHIKRALVRLNFGAGGDAAIDLCRVITDHAEALVRYERKGIRTTNPAPSELLRTADVHRRRMSTPTPRPPAAAAGLRVQGADVDAALRPGAERREAPREKIGFCVRLEPGGQRAIARDLSAVGIRLEASPNKPPSGTVGLTLFTSDGTIHTRGTVRWTREGPPATGRTVTFGVRFTNPDERLRALGNRA